MDDAIKSPFIKDKPAWHMRYSRRWQRYALACLLLVAGQLTLGISLGFSDTIVTIYSVCMLIYVFGYQLHMAIWLRSQGASWTTRAVLERVEGVPCPNCLYPLCRLHEADSVHVCSECGCTADGVEVIKSWGSVKGYRLPQAWNRWLKDS
ncbi:MAG: hypothetical protein JJ974_12285 [Phycisphaerales bacterium]|nr:hypothetical protein [Phycisphaerales bacterium]